MNSPTTYNLLFEPKCKPLTFTNGYEQCFNDNFSGNSIDNSERYSNSEFEFLSL